MENNASTEKRLPIEARQSQPGASETKGSSVHKDYCIGLGIGLASQKSSPLSDVLLMAIALGINRRRPQLDVETATRRIEKLLSTPTYLINSHIENVAENLPDQLRVAVERFDKEFMVHGLGADELDFDSTVEQARTTAVWIARYCKSHGLEVRIVDGYLSRNPYEVISPEPVSGDGLPLVYKFGGFPVYAMGNQTEDSHIRILAKVPRA